MEPQEAEPELFATDDTSQSDAKADEPVVLEKTDSEILDFDDTSGTSDMHRPKSHLAGSGVRGQEANKATTSKQQVKTSSGLKTQSSAAGSKSRNVTTKAKGSTEGLKRVLSSDTTAQKECSNDKTVSIIPTLKDQSSSSLSSAKSRIPKRSTSPVTADKTLPSDGPGQVASSKLKRQNKIKEPLKSPVATKAERKPSFEEAKRRVGDVSSTKTAYKTTTKTVNEKTKEDSDSVFFANSLEKEHEKSSVKITAAEESQDVNNQSLENKLSPTSRSRLPVTSPTRRRSEEIPETKSASFKKQDVHSPSETPPPESPNKGRSTMLEHVNALTYSKLLWAFIFSGLFRQ